MVLTRAQETDAFNHVVTTVMHQNATSPLRNTFKQDGVSTIADLIAYTPTKIDTMTYTDADSKPQPLPKGYKNIMHALIAFILYKASIGDTITDADWENLPVDEFNSYRLSPEFVAYRSGTLPTVARPNVVTSSTFNRNKDPVMEFKRGIKRDVTYFIQLNDEKQWDNWQRTTVAQARAQDASEILDPNYVP